MVLITEEMVRSRSEHNNCEIFSLEEVSLHQQNIERIEHIDRWCRELKILYLQNNLIPKIESVSRLKKLEYLNLALNNIELIENLEGCESLQKLDLTVNFVGQVSSVESLRSNLHLRELFLVGNPCTEFEGYRQYVVASLPQLKWLDGKEIGRSERIRAGQGLEEVRRRIKQQEQEYLKKRRKEKEESNKDKLDDKVLTDKKKPGFDGRWYTDINNTVPEPEGNEENPKVEQSEKETASLSSVEKDKEFWEKPCAFTPESRLEAHQHQEDMKKKKQRGKEKKPKAPRTLITPEGRVMNVNEAKLGFVLRDEEDKNMLVLDLEVYRHMDTSLMDVDIQPVYARVTIKGKIFQLVLPTEVQPDSSTAKRSQTTGHLVLTMPKAQGEIKPAKTASRPSKSSQCTSEEKIRKDGGTEHLEVDPSKHSVVDFANIVPRTTTTRGGPLEISRKQHPSATEDFTFSDGFVDDPDVPPLI
ncbi:dynein axonemal assembly factor 11 isoform X1 [Osmerus eperlanus]|uniref:dynein axonemal assembly factor 11 isoform X1 n=2 Tax=Osmerus eperlanus TaxID=29151 RepID=UPI002E0E6D17